MIWEDLNENLIVPDLEAENSEEVFLHYGYNAQWDNVSEVEMVKTELGFQAEMRSEF